MGPIVLPLVNILVLVYFQRSFRTVTGRVYEISKLWAIHCVSVIFVTPFGWNLMQKHSHEVSFETAIIVCCYSSFRLIFAKFMEVFDFYSKFIMSFFLNFLLDWNRFYGEELYDHTTDPDEYINLYDRQEFAAIKLQLKNLLRTKLDN